MDQLESLKEMWQKDAILSLTELSHALLEIPKIQSKYMNISSSHRLLVEELKFKFNKLRKLKWEYYTGKLDQQTLMKHGWDPFPYVLKSEINYYLEADDDLIKLQAKRAYHEEVVNFCHLVIKELQSRTYQLRSAIDYEKFIHGA